MKSLTILAATLALSGTPAAAAYIYTPAAGYEFTEGDGNNSVFVQNAASHLQWRYDAAIFGDDPLVIHGFSFRFDRAYAGSVKGKGTFDLSDAFHVKLNTLGQPLSETFADNLAGAATVMSGARKLPYLTGAPAGQTKPFGVHFVFDTPYLFDPSAGDLIVDMFTPAQKAWGTFDFVLGHPLQNRIFNKDATALTGDEQAFGPVTRFDVSPAPVPEPGTWALMILGFGGVGAALRRRVACGSVRTPLSQRG